MTINEFVDEFREVLEVFEKKISDAYIRRLYEGLKRLTIPEFRAIKTRAINESDFFPKISKWISLKDWIISRRPPRVPYPCQHCNGRGYFDAICKVEVFNEFAKIQTRENLTQWVDRIGTTTLNQEFGFICDCRNGDESPGPAKMRWQDYFRVWYEPKWEESA